jgi:hypothetical protein
MFNVAKMMLVIWMHGINSIWCNENLENDFCEKKKEQILKPIALFINL